MSERDTELRAEQPQISGGSNTPTNSPPKATPSTNGAVALKASGPGADQVNPSLDKQDLPTGSNQGPWDRVPGGVMIFVAAAAVLAATIALSELPIPPLFANDGAFTLRDKVLLAFSVLSAILAITLLLSGIRRMVSSGPRTEGSFTTSLLSSAIADLSAGAAIMVVIAVLFGTDRPWNVIGVGAGLATAVLAAVVYATVQRGRTWAYRVNPWQYGQLAEQWAALNASRVQICRSGDHSPQPACAEVNAHLDYVAHTLGFVPIPSVYGAGRNGASNESLGASEQPADQSVGTNDRWILGIGFIEIWERIHAADAALYPLRPNNEIIAGGVVDELRVLGSGMANETELLKRLRYAVAILGGKSYLFDSSAVADIADSDEATKLQAKKVLASVRQAIEKFRDTSRSGLARTRIHLIWTGLVTEIVAVTLLVLAILLGAEATHIVAGVTFFLVASVIGLLSQLRSLSSDTRSGEDDFGLDNARMLYTPVLSGLAGVGGVLIMAMLYPTLNVALDPTQLSYEAEPGMAADQTLVTLPGLGQIFSLEDNRFGVIVAAVFGLTPDLLINRLQGQADRYKVDLENTSVQARNPAPTPFPGHTFTADGKTVVTRADAPARNP